MATILIDTHVWLWLRAEPERLNETARTTLVDADHDVVLSVVSVVEISIKYAIGKLALPDSPDRFIPSRIVEDQISVLNMTLQHGLILADLPLHHRDPFDRMLVAQAMCENLPIMTADSWFQRYGISVIPAAS